MPSMSAFTPLSAVFRNSGVTASRARRILSATTSRSRANEVTPYRRESAISRSVRLRRFSISASVRNSRSFMSACSRSSALDGAAVCACSDGPACASWPSSSTRAVWSVIISYRSKITIRDGGTGRAPFVTLGYPSLRVCRNRCPAYQGANRKNQAECKASTAEQFTNDFCRVVDHRHDAGIVEPGWTDDAENADDLSGRVVIGGDDGRGAGQRKQLVFRADEDAHAFGLLGAAKQIDHLAPGFEVIEQEPHAFEVGERLEVLKQMRLTPHDQLALFILAARPARQALGDDLLRQLIELRFALFERALDLGLHFQKRMTANPRIEKIRGFDQRRGRQPDRNIENAVFDLPVLADQNDHGALGLKPHELDMFEPRVRFGGEHHAGGAAQPGEQARSFGQHAFDRFCLAGGRDLRLDRFAIGIIEISDLHQRVDEEAQPYFSRQTARRSVRSINQAELFEIGHDVAH